MPIEREFKFILHSPEKVLEKVLRDASCTGNADINQGYLSKGGRVRSRKWWMKGGQIFYDSPALAKIEYIFTYKHDLSSQPGVLEIETELSEDDFKLAWADADHKIVKARYLLTGEGKQVWELDFFRDSQGNYLALAELEVPADSGPPDRLHPLVEEFLLYTVPEGDSRFANRRLCTREKVEVLLQEIAQQNG